MSQHTPGPWDCYIDRHGFVTLSAGAAYVKGPEDGFNISGFMSAADAQLMASAPELLAEVERLKGVVADLLGR